ncbi:Glycosyltransferase [Psidium guajava]|nr:Glycosyltransferase [Psidium guajava]
MKRGELVFVPSPGIGQLVPAVEVAKLLVQRDHRLSATIFIITLPFDNKIITYADSLASSSSSIDGRVKFVTLPEQKPASEGNFLTSLIEIQKPHVRKAAARFAHSESGPEEPRLAAFVIGMFCTTMIDVANEFGVPTYVFYTSSAGALGLMLHLQTLRDVHSQDITELKDSDTELTVPSCVNPVPAKVLPSVVLNRDWSPVILDQFQRFKETKGILVNSFLELECHAVNSFANSEIPSVYPVGPILDLRGDAYAGSCDDRQRGDLICWLDDQPPASVVFLCFGSMGSFSKDQVREIACALEQSSYRFLWSLRRPPPKGTMGYPSDYSDPKSALPEGFLERMATVGRVIGWAPQVAVLAHPAVGGFVSHCGWNSVLESLWYGVPVATWPLHSEQQFNAFEMVRELGLSVEIRMDYRRDVRAESESMVCADEIERGLKRLMESGNAMELRKKVEEMKAKCRMATMEGGSSYSSLGLLISEILDNMQ